LTMPDGVYLWTTDLCLDCDMPVYWVPVTFQEQLKVVQDLKKLEPEPEELTRLSDMERHLTDYGFATDEETNSLQSILDQYGWMLE